MQLGIVGWGAGFELAAAPAPPPGAQAPASGGAGRLESSEGGLKRLWTVLEKQLKRPKKALPLPWREAILPPNTSRLVWYPGMLSARPGGEVFRAAVDPMTQWYFVAQMPADDARPRFFGPIAEASPGVFVEAIGSSAAPARAPPQKRPKQ